MSDSITNPKHYEYPISPLDFIMANGLDFPQGCIIKYAVRAGRKGGKQDAIQDCRKIIAYATKMMEAFEAED